MENEKRMESTRKRKGQISKLLTRRERFGYIKIGHSESKEKEKDDDNDYQVGSMVDSLAFHQ